MTETSISTTCAVRASLAATKGRKPPKLVHKLVFSMPPGTPPAKVVGAVGNLARERFWGQHRYALTLHTMNLTRMSR
jgi:hypothetical protein